MTVSTSAYASGDSIGGAVKLSRLLEQYGAGVLKNVVVIDKDNQKPALTIFFFDRPPAATDNAAFSPTAAEIARCIGMVPVASADYTTVGSRAVANVDCADVLQARPDTAGDPTQAAGDIWAVLVTTSTPTYTTTTGLDLRLGVLLD
jgi:hypothetical protein